MPQLIPYIDTRAAWSERDRAAHYREQADNFRRMAKMETQVRARARLLELGAEYQRLANSLDGPKSAKNVPR